MRTGLLFAPLALVVCALPAFAQPDLSLDHMAGTEPLAMDEPLDVVMVRGINYFAERELADSPNRRAAKWNRDYSSAEAYQKSIEPNRQRLREIIGAVDERVTVSSSALDSMFDQSVSANDDTTMSVCRGRWDVLPGVTGEAPSGSILNGRPGHSCTGCGMDAEMLFEGIEGLPEQQSTGLRLAEAGWHVSRRP
jgi:hypothetical protein